MSRCLSMIIRNESAVLTRCLNSVVPHVTHYAIVDTGSEDSTVEMALACLRGLEGKLMTTSWNDNFSFHRNQALELAQTVLGPAGGQIMFIDADEHFSGNLGTLSSDDTSAAHAWNWWAHDGDFRYRKLGLVDSACAKSWHGTRHEWLDLRARCQVSYIETGHIEYGHDGARRRDAAALLNDLGHLACDTYNERKTARDHYFYARTLEALGWYQEAVQQYHVASSLSEPGSDENWQSLWGRARASSAISNSPSHIAADAYFAAHLADNSRAEPVLALAKIAYMQAQFCEALALAKYARSCPFPTDTSMYDHSAYTWRADELIFNAQSQLFLPSI